MSEPKTPRTDTEKARLWSQGLNVYEIAEGMGEFAGVLERELAAACAELATERSNNQLLRQISLDADTQMIIHLHGQLQQARADVANARELADAIKIASRFCLAVFEKCEPVNFSKAEALRLNLRRIEEISREIMKPGTTRWAIEIAAAPRGEGEK